MLKFLGIAFDTSTISVREGVDAFARIILCRDDRGAGYGQTQTVTVTPISGSATGIFTLIIIYKGAHSCFETIIYSYI